jgi:hypothetical protein
MVTNRKKKTIKRKAKKSKRVKKVNERPADPLLRDIELDMTQLYDIRDVTGTLIERAQRLPSSASQIAIMYPCPGCGPDSGKSVGIPLWVDSPILMTVTCLAGHDYLLRILPPLITETTFAPRVEFFTSDAVITEDEASAEIAALEAKAKERTASGPLLFMPK